MKKRTFLGIVGMIVFIATSILTNELFASLGITLAAAWITAGSEYNGKETLDILLRPLFVGTQPKDMGIRIIDTKKAGSVKLTVFDTLTKILMPYASGWQGGSAASKRQKKFTLAEFKAEASYEKHDYYDTILEQLTNRMGVSQNDISGTKIHEAEKAVFMNGISYDIWRYFWLGDTDQKHYEAGTYPDGTTTYVVGDENKYYSTVDGIWKWIFDNDAAYSSATVNEVRRVTIANGAVAQSEKQTLSGTTAGTITITVYGKDYDEAFDTDVATTVTNWHTSHAAEFATLNITVTDDLSAALTFTSSIAGKPFTLVTTDAGTNGTWTESAVTANTAPADLTTDEALTTFKTMLRNSTKELKSLQRSGKLKMYCTDSMIENYVDTLTDDGTEAGHRNIVDGVQRYYWNGIPLIPMDIDGPLAADFVGEYPHRAILTVADNLCLVISQANGWAETAFWFDRNNNENRQRTQFEFGTGVVMPELMTVAY